MVQGQAALAVSVLHVRDRLVRAGRKDHLATGVIGPQRAEPVAIEQLQEVSVGVSDATWKRTFPQYRTRRS